jgi:hypothetical protein
VFIKELGNIRAGGIEYLKWVLELLAYYRCLYDQTLLNLFHFYWREAHDELYFSIGITAIGDKLIPFLYPMQYKRK